MTAHASPSSPAAAGHSEDHGHGSLRGYLIGFGLSVLLTAIPFWLVMGDALGSKLVTAITIMVLAAAQIVVHMIYFLHMNARAEEGWTMMALIFTIIMVVIALSGSLWVMYHLNTNMMPLHDMSRMP
ncbi:cytochrome o ubiquinol oxidase subunit IV [Reyranella sp. CPCC 100927]|uniref:cytochrome o ubiquinol oxidase subunit IV n=1 Tax=Reyranella sp. CPCC 100927 TaxID=2599616 RepID=UPI0011B7902E|nr:cytochrome o ubiquinol oxidase subunit IV [Reyranella sp. CPCC 100927]TWT11399.1 cytochrome o ubiquinol oxidase subunit IV [Reyranella sp. CPCC 100927]